MSVEDLKFYQNIAAIRSEMLLNEELLNEAPRKKKSTNDDESLDAVAGDLISQMMQDNNRQNEKLLKARTAREFPDARYMGHLNAAIDNEKLTIRRYNDSSSNLDQAIAVGAKRKLKILLARHAELKKNPNPTIQTTPEFEKLKKEMAVIRAKIDEFQSKIDYNVRMSQRNPNAYKSYQRDIDAYGKMMKEQYAELEKIQKKMDQIDLDMPDDVEPAINAVAKTTKPKTVTKPAPKPKATKPVVKPVAKPAEDPATKYPGFTYVPEGRDFKKNVWKKGDEYIINGGHWDGRVAKVASKVDTMGGANQIVVVMINGKEEYGRFYHAAAKNKRYTEEGKSRLESHYTNFGGLKAPLYYKLA